MIKNIFLIIFLFTCCAFYGQKKTSLKYSLKKYKEKNTPNSCIIKANKDTIYTKVGSIEAMTGNRLKYRKPNRSSDKYIHNIDHAINGTTRFKPFKFQGSNRKKILKIEHEDTNTILGTCYYQGKYFNHTYYYLIEKGTNRLILKDSYRHGQRTKKSRTSQENYKLVVKKHFNIETTTY